MQNPDRLITNVGLDNNSIANINFIGIILGSASLLVSYEGFQLIAYGVDEMKETEEGLKMMKYSLLISMIIYFLVGFTTMAVLGVSGLMGDNPQEAEVAIATAALISIGTLGMFIIIIGALLSTTSALNATMLGSSRLAFMMSKDKVLPEEFSRISKNKVPYISIIITGTLCIILTLFTGGALAIAGVAGLIFSQIFFIINFSNFKARKDTNSNAVLPIVGMILTGSLFTILLVYNILNFENGIFVLISFFLMEGVTLFFVFHISKNNNKNNL